jgi:hypothetical protein
MSPVLVMIGGGEGLAGLVAPRFTALGWEVAGIGSAPWAGGADRLALDWDGGGAWALALEGAGAVVQFPGGGEAQTARVASAVRACRVPPRVWIHVSSTDWYAAGACDRPDEWVGERGEDAGARRVCSEEEAFFREPVAAETRKLVLRVGLVVCAPSVAVGQGMAGVMAAVGSGEISWIHAEDFAAAIEWAVADPFLSGVVNAVAPESAAWSVCHHACLEGLVSVVVPGGGAAFPWEARAAMPLRLRDEGFRWRHPVFGDWLARGRQVEAVGPVAEPPSEPTGRRLAAAGSG